MIYEIINPSDAYTLIAEDRSVAAVVCLLLGDGKYALRPEADGAPDVPMFLFATAEDIDKWFLKEFGRTAEQCMDGHEQDIIDCLATVLIGDRKQHDDLRGLIVEEKLPEFETKWHASHRSSMNDIGARAKHYEKQLRATLKKI
jgi:hypothetical protein